MTAQPGATPEVPAAEDGRVWVERAGAGAYLGHNGRAAPLRIGAAGAPGAYSPTELLRLALAGCAGLSAEHVITRRLGEHAELRIAVDADHDPAERRFESLTSTITLDLSGLDPVERERLRTVVTRAVHRYCTVGRTVEHGAPVPVVLGNLE